LVTDTAASTSQRRTGWFGDLSVQILLAVLLGIAVGVIWPASADYMKPLGDLFIKLVGMLVAPIVFCTVVHGIASVREARSVGRVIIKALVYFQVVAAAGLVLALVLVNWWQPGAGMHVDPSSLQNSGAASIAASAKKVTIADFLTGIVPNTFFGAFADGEVLPVLFISILFAFALLSLGPAGAPVVRGIEVLSRILFRMIAYVMAVAPIGAFGAIGYAAGKFGPSSLLSLGRLVAHFYVCCGLFIVLVLWPVAAAFGVNFPRLVRYLGAELLLVVGTSSGESVFPRINTKLRQLGCGESVVSLVLPAGYAFNHGGSCLYYATVSVFLAQALDIHLAITQQLELLGIMLITSMGGAGIAGSAIVMLATTLSATGAIPVTAVGLILGVHRLLSSAFVPVNVLGNSLATVIVARMEGALDRTRFESELGSGGEPLPA
jgi:aerobic C4-dicarboxylate transport protein